MSISKKKDGEGLGPLPPLSTPLANSIIECVMQGLRSAALDDEQ